MARRLARALALRANPGVHTMLCQRELGLFVAGAQGDVVVACTQEQQLLSDAAQEGGKTQAIRFVNIRETGGWSNEAHAATPKIAALLAMAALPDPEPVPSVGYESGGQVLITGPLGAALYWAEALKDRLDVTVLATGRTMGEELPAERAYPSVFGRTQGAGRMARRVRRGVDAGQSDRSRPVHTLQCLHSCVSGVGHRLELPDRSRPLPRPSQMRRRVRRRRRDRLRSAGHATRRTLRSGLRPARRSPGSSCTSRRRAISRREAIPSPRQGWPWKSRR